MSNSSVIISKKLAAKNAASFALVRLLHATVFLWVQQYLLHRISPEEYGIYQVIGGIFFLVPILSLIFTSSSSRYVVNHYARNELSEAQRVISSIFPVLLFLSFVLLLIGLAITAYIDHVFVVSSLLVFDARCMMLLLTSSVVINLVLIPFTLGLHVKQKFVLTNWINIVAEVFRIVTLLYLLFYVSPRALWVVVAYAAAEILSIVARVIVSHQLLPELRFSLKESNISIIKQLTDFGIWNTIIALSRYVGSYAILIIMNKCMTYGSIKKMSVEVVCVSIGLTAYRQLLTLWEPVRASLSPPLIAMHATGQDQRLQRSYLMGGRYALWLVMAATIPLVIFRHEFVILYATNMYSLTTTVIVLMLLPIPFQIANVMLPQIALAKARQKGLALRFASTQIVLLSLIFVSVTFFNGGSIAVAICFATVNVVGEVFLIWPHARRLIEINWNTQLVQTVLPGLLPGFIGIFFWIFVKNIFYVRSWLGLALAVLPGLFVYSLFAYLIENHAKKVLNSYTR